MSVAQLQQVVAEQYIFDNAEQSQPEGTFTYRIYAEMASADDKVSAVFAIQDCHSLNISTTTSFFNSEFGGITPASISPALYPAFPTVEADSWVTVGVENNTSPGAGDVSAIANIPPDPYNGALTFGGTANSIQMDDGAWFTLATSPSSLPVGPQNRVILGQFTTDGELSFDLNIQVFLGGDQDNRVDYVWSETCNTPGGTLTGFEQEDETLSQSGIFAGGEDPAGCTNPLADNYDAEATEDDGSCEYSGCTDPNADNFNPQATIDDGSCGILDCPYEGEYWLTFTKENFADWTLEENQDRITDNVWITRQDIQGLYNAFDQNGWPGNAIGGPSNTEWKIGGVDSAEPWETWIEAADNQPGVTLNQNPLLGLRIIDQDLYFNVVWLSFTGGNNGGGFSYTRVLDIEESGCTLIPLQYGCTDVTACNYNPEANVDDDSCTFPEEEYLDCEGNCLNDADNDGLCDELEVAGCTDPLACNFDPEATDDDGSCEFAVEFFDCDGNCLNDADEDGICDELEIPGCTDPEACNFVAEATDDDGSCEFAEEFFDCDGNCLNDADDDGVCDEFEIPGCTDPEACNFVAEATDEDGSCTYPEEEYLDCDGNCLNDADGDGICDELEIAGCTDPEACNYDEEATDDDGSCTYIEEFSITGEGNPVEGSTETYTYENTAGSTYDWTVTGGTIVSGQGTNEITVEWDTPGAGSVAVIETNEAGCEGPEVTLIVTIQEGVSVDEIISIELDLWPNPANESITIEPGVEGLFELRILDATGREVYRTSINGRTVVATSSLSSGNYFLQLTGDRAIATERFSVVR